MSGWTRSHPGLLAVLVFSALQAAAESSAFLTCSAASLSEGFVVYQLSEAPSSAACYTCWEDRDKYVLARQAIFDPDRVQNLTSQTITLKRCHDNLIYTRECSGDHEEVHCRVNCSTLMESLHTPTVNSTLTCIFKSWCPSLTEVGLGIAAVLLVLFSVLVVLWRFKFISICNRQRSASQATSYTPVILRDIKSNVV